MRKVEYLSPTSISTYLGDKDEFYRRYLSDRRFPREPQTTPMAVGSAFDAFAKSWLFENIFGKTDPRFQLENLFESQVERHARDQAWVDGKFVFDFYKETGALSDLLLDLQKSVGPPRFELEVRGVINGYREGVEKEIGGITFLGKPDVFYINEKGHHVILDWKVNGFYSNYKKYPEKGYIRLRDLKNKLGSRHKDAFVQNLKGTLVNVAHTLEMLNEDWARQLAIYGWLCGEEVGSDFITGIDQFCGPKTELRVAEHRVRVSKKFQQQTFETAMEVWNACQTGILWPELNKEENQARMELLSKAEPDKDWLCR